MKKWLRTLKDKKTFSMLLGGVFAFAALAWAMEAGETGGHGEFQFFSFMTSPHYAVYEKVFLWIYWLTPMELLIV